MLIYIFIAILCGIISAILANSKGRNPIAWFFAGLLLSIAGLIIIAVLSKKIKNK